MTNIEYPTSAPHDVFVVVDNIRSFALDEPGDVLTSFDIKFDANGQVTELDARIHPETPPVLVDQLTVLSGASKAVVRHAPGAQPARRPYR